MSKEAYKTTIESLKDLEQYVGKEIGISKWFTITQEMINSFGVTTMDEQWIHMDVEKAKAHSPYGAPIAHGFLIMSLLVPMSYDVLKINDVKMGVNYGANKLRFTNATKAGARVRGVATIKEIEYSDRGAKYITNWVVEIEGEEKPAMIAEWIGVAYN